MFKRLKIFQRMLLTLMLAIVGTGTVATGWLLSTYDILMQDRQDKTRNVVDVVHSLLTYYEGAERDGRMSREQAQDEAKKAMRLLRYDEKEYFWVNDLDARIVMHPIKPELDGKDLSQFKDPAGKPIFVEFASVARQHGGASFPTCGRNQGRTNPLTSCHMSRRSSHGAGSSDPVSTSTTSRRCFGEQP